MTASTLPITPSGSVLPARAARRLLLAGAVVGLGDWLFYGHRPGLSVALFALALGLATLATNRLRSGRRERWAAGGLLALACLPAAADLNLLSFLFCAGGLAAFAPIVTGQGSQAWARKPWQAFRLLVSGPARLAADLWRLRGFQVRAGRWPGFASLVVPVVFAAIFGALFAEANPLVERWLASLDPSRLLALLDVWRTVFWLLVLCAAWPFLHVRLPLPAETSVRKPDETATPPGSIEDRLFGRAAIGRSLALFNALFAVQTALDAAYLWGGLALPTGMSYAAYAHRGAYPLILTALLAAGFVLVAMRPGGPAEGSRVLRILVYAWIGQNVGLVLSSMVRLDLYVAAYSLTYWRLAALIWMGLVAAGLLLILARIALGRSNGWLVSRNVAVLTLTLYSCCFVDFASVIAGYNLSHGQFRASGALDLAYLRSLGPGAVPAIDAALERAPSASLATVRRDLAAQQGWRDGDWRAWGFLDWRLARYLATRPGATFDASTAAP